MGQIAMSGFSFMDIVNSDELERFTPQAQQAIVFEAEHLMGPNGDFAGEGNSAIAFLGCTKVTHGLQKAGVVSSGDTLIGSRLKSPRGSSMDQRELAPMLKRQKLPAVENVASMIFTVMQQLCAIVPEGKSITLFDYAAGLYLWGDDSLRKFYQDDQYFFMSFVRPDSVSHDTSSRLLVGAR